MRVLTLILAIASLTACSEGTGPGTEATGRVRLSLTTGTGASGGPAIAASETYTVGGTTLVLSRVQLVLREIELKRTEDSTTCSDDSDGGADDECEEIEFGPILLDLPLNGSLSQVVTVEADTGTYRELEFEVHKPEDDAEDAAFLAQHPDFRRVSIRVEGTWNGTPFVFLSDLGVEQELDLVPPLRIEAAGNAELTLRVDLRSWFLNSGGTALINPATANKGQAAEGLVKENITRSFEAFENDD
jgi:hypothetical protein